MNADQIAALRAAARSTGGNFIRLDDPGDWFAGTVVGHQTVTTDFGDTQELILSNVTQNDVPQDGTLTFRLSRSVLRAELASDADKDTPGPGWSVYVVYRGQRSSKAGRQYHAYEIAKQPPASDADIAAAVAAAASLGATPVSDDEPIPF